ncbi:unnamed protein product, partial [Symbiodinium natans]
MAMRPLGLEVPKTVAGFGEHLFEFNEADCRAACRLDATCSGYIMQVNQCYRSREVQRGGPESAVVKVTKCTEDSACMEVTHGDWYKAGIYCPVSRDLFRSSMLYRKDGMTPEETLYLAKYSSSLDGALEGVSASSDGSWILRQAMPELDFIDPESGEVELRGPVVASPLIVGVTAQLLPCIGSNAGNPSAYQYSILDQRENFRVDGGFAFKLLGRLSWPGSGLADQVWKQTSDPLTSWTVDGYEAIDAPHGSGFRGLSKSHVALMDGNNGGSWWYA